MLHYFTLALFLLCIRDEACGSKFGYGFTYVSGSKNAPKIVEEKPKAINSKSSSWLQTSGFQDQADEPYNFALFNETNQLFHSSSDAEQALIAWANLDADAKNYYKNPRNVPSDSCPRDEEQATSQGRTCLRKCTTDEDCRSPRKKCLCDGICGLSCIKPDKECPELKNPDKGRVFVSGRFYSDRAMYSCDDDNRLVGLETRICQADGTWSGMEPICRPNLNPSYCFDPPTVEHARHNAPAEQTTFALDTMLQYQCYPGYTTTGFARAKCLLNTVNGTAIWYGPDVNCEPRSCGNPGDMLNGRHEGDCYTFSCRVTYSCQPGFDLVGRANRYCQADGTWTPAELPTCVPVQCPIPDNPINGKAIFTSISYNSIISYECKYGFSLLGESTRRCGTDKRWSGEEPYCKEINCGSPGLLANGWIEGIHTTLHAAITYRCLDNMKFVGANTRATCQLNGKWSHGLPQCAEINCGNPGPIYNGWIENLEHGTALGASIIYRCFESMIMVGSAANGCQSDGKWRYPPPLCYAPCLVPSVEFGKVQGASPGATIPHAQTLSLECSHRYEPSYGFLLPTCNNGSWTINPKCEAARCKQLPIRPRHGMVIAPKTEHGMRALFKCKDGYTLQGNNVTECRYGNWTGETPVCVEVYCPFPGYLENGKVLLVGNMGLYDYRPYVRKVTNNRQIMFECDKGFILDEGPPGATCVAGRWSPKMFPRCISGKHPRLRWARAVRSLRRKRNVLRVQRPISHRTGGGGGSGRDIGKRRLKHKQSYNDGSKPMETDYCPPLAIEPYAHMEIVKQGKNPNETFGTGTVVRVTCSKGYALNVGNRTVRCKEGRWKPKVPICLTSPCIVPAAENAIFKRNGLPTEEGAEIPHNETLEFSCTPGFSVQGNEALRCWYGEWAVTQKPECAPAPCELPKIPNGQYTSGYRAGLTIAHGSIVDYTCSELDYEKMNSLPIRCRMGELLPQSPLCKSRSRSGMGDSSQDGKKLVGFQGGSDITIGGEMSLIDYSLPNKKTCGPPARIQGSLIFRNGEPLNDSERRFPDSTEVTFRCVTSIMGEKTSWQIVCEDGSWVGRSLSCDGEEPDVVSAGSNRSCIFRNDEPNLVTFYEDQQITEDFVEFPPGTELVSRCSDIGKYALLGSVRRKCTRGEWTGVKPTCFGLNQENDYAQKPPTILFRHQLGPIAQSNDGKLIVYPGTILHMECLWIRRFGVPKWEVSHNYRKYPEGWTTDAGRDPQLEFRLSILHAQKDDSGTFTCVTPTRHSHKIEIAVKAIHCPTIPDDRKGLVISNKNTKMNTKVLFSCQNGNSLIGAPEITCLPSGNWNAPIPICESVECPELSNITGRSLRISTLSREVGGRALFSCPPGFALRGPTETICQPNGEWATPLPKCEEVQCDSPEIPENGYIQGGTVFKSGDVIQFHCHGGFMMEGQPILVCQDSGRWSGPAPKCIQACTYPGTTIGGTMSSVKFFYSIGETVAFDCASGLSLVGSKMLRCLKNGKWSNAIPTCVPIPEQN